MRTLETRNSKLEANHKLELSNGGVAPCTHLRVSDFEFDSDFGFRVLSFHARGVAILEMIVTVAVLGVLLVAATRVARQSLEVSAMTRRAQVLEREIGPVKAAMQADVWNALEFQTPDAWTLIVRQAEARSVIWRVVDDVEAGRGVQLERAVWSEGRMLAQLRWPVALGEIRLRRDGPMLLATFTPGRGEPITEQWCSQLEILSGGAP